MHFRCKCGHSISDTTDNLPYAAHLVADVNCEDYWEAWERRGRGQALGNLMDPFDYEQTIYQCEECGRIWFDDPEDPSRLISFMPEDKNVMVTGPVEGREWKGFIYGLSDLGMERSMGSCFVCRHDGRHMDYRFFKSYEEMRAHFDEKVEELKSKDLLRSAWINKDGETVYRWSLDDEVPVQEKHELYLTDDERMAFAEFKAEHAECHHKYPRGPRGWDFAYEVLPGISGADDRDLKVTCLRCGATLESIDGKIARKEGYRTQEEGADRLMRAILDLLHERGSRDVRAETISMPGRHYDVAEAIGYVRGIVDVARIINPDTPLGEIAQHAFALTLDEDRFSATPQLRSLVRHACEGEGFDWVLEEGMEVLKVILRKGYPAIVPDWIDEPKNERHGPSMVKEQVGK